MIQARNFPHDDKPPAAPTDALLVALAAAGDEAGSEQLVRRFTPLLMAALHGRVRDRADAEDIMQETFIAAFPHLAKLRNPEILGPWLMRIARNKLKDHYRARARRPMLEMIPGGAVDDEADPLARIASPDLNPAQRARMAQTRRIVMEVLAEFPERYRIILYLKIIEEYEPHEIAARMALKESTVRMRLKRGLEKMRSKLARRGIGHRG